MRKIDKFLIFIIIINLFVTIFILFGKEKKPKEQVFEIGNFSEFMLEYRAGPSTERYKTFIEGLINTSFKEIHESTKDLSDAQLKQYYDKNNIPSEVSILSPMGAKYGISDYDTFEKLVKKLRIINEKGATYKKCSIVKNSCEMNSDYTTSELLITYSKSQKIHLIVEMSNIVETDIQMFKISVKEEI